MLSPGALNSLEISILQSPHKNQLYVVLMGDLSLSRDKLLKNQSTCQLLIPPQSSDLGFGAVLQSSISSWEIP